MTELTPFDAMLLQYARNFDLLQDASRDIAYFLNEIATAASIKTHDISSRPKSISSFESKALKKVGGTPKYADPSLEIKDAVAARAIFFTNRSRDAFAEQLERYFDIVENLDSQGRHFDGYNSVHLIVKDFTKDDERQKYPALARYFKLFPGLEIQLRSIAAHAWAAFSHDTKYKARKGTSEYDSLSANLKQQVDQLFVEAGGMRKQMDALFDEIESILLPDSQESSTPPASPRSEERNLDVEHSPQAHEQLTLEALKKFASDMFPDTGPSSDEEAASVLETLKQLKKDDYGSLMTHAANTGNQVAELMAYPQTPSAVRVLDDELLASLGDQYIDATQTIDEDRASLLQLRQRRLAGKFAIYSIEHGDERIEGVPAARAVRELARIVTDHFGLGAADVEAAIDTEPEVLLPSTHAKTVKTSHGNIYVASNLSRAWAEELIMDLTARMPAGSVKAKRAGDIIAEGVS